MKFNNTVPIQTITPTPLEKVVSDAILHILPTVLTFIAFTLAGIGISIFAQDLSWFVYAVASGLIVSAIVMLIVSAHGLINLLEIGFQRDFNGDHTIGGVTMNSEDEVELESRVDRFLRAITDQGASHTRHYICDELGLLTQSEWKSIRDRCIELNIISADGTRLNAVSYKQARATWDANLPSRFVNIGERGNPRMVRASGLKAE